MALTSALVAAAMLLAANVNAQCPTCDPNNGAQAVCVVDTTTNGLQQFISLCEMDLFNCQNNRNVYQPLYYGACTTSTYQPPSTQTVNQPVYTQTVNYPATAGANYYGTQNTQPNYAYSGTDANGDWSVRLLSYIDPNFLATRGMNQATTGNAYQYVPRSNTNSPAVGTKTYGGTTNTFVPSSGNNGYQAGAVYNFAQRSGVGGGYAVGSKTGVVATPNKVGSVPQMARNPVPSPAGGVKAWASNKGSVAAPVGGRFGSSNVNRG